MLCCLRGCLKLCLTVPAGDLHRAQAPGDAHGLAAGGTLEIVVLLVGLDGSLFLAEPLEEVPDEGLEPGIFHLAVGGVSGQQAEDQVDQSHQGREEEGEVEPTQGRENHHDGQPEQAVEVKARMFLEEIKIELFKCRVQLVMAPPYYVMMLWICVLCDR